MKFFSVRKQNFQSLNYSQELDFSGFMDYQMIFEWNFAVFLYIASIV
jgi:hypothetical protein